MTKLLISVMGLLMMAPAAMARLECPAKSTPLAERDLYVDKHLAEIGGQPDPDAKAIEQVTLAACIVKWCTPMYDRHRTVARAALVQARQNPLTANKAKRLEATLATCKGAPKATPPPPPPAKSQWKAIAGWSAIGLGVVAGAVGYVFQIEEENARDAHEDATDAMEAAATINGHRADIESWRNRKGATWIAGGVIAAAGIGLLIWDAVDDAPVKAWIGPGTVGVGGRF